MRIHVVMFVLALASSVSADEQPMQLVNGHVRCGNLHATLLALPKRVELKRGSELRVTVVLALRPGERNPCFEKEGCEVIAAIRSADNKRMIAWADAIKNQRIGPNAQMTLDIRLPIKEGIPKEDGAIILTIFSNEAVGFTWIHPVRIK